MKSVKVVDPVMKSVNKIVEPMIKPVNKFVEPIMKPVNQVIEPVMKQVREIVKRILEPIQPVVKLIDPTHPFYYFKIFRQLKIVKWMYINVIQHRKNNYQYIYDGRNN